MSGPAALSTVGEGNAEGPSWYVTDRELRGRGVKRVGFAFEAERHLGILVRGASDGSREA